MNLTRFRVYDKPLKNGTLNAALIQLRGHRCECCGNEMWLNQPITLQIHHRNGDRKDNRLENLELLCPNCHSYTDNFGAKNIKNKEVSDEDLIQALQNNPSIRQALFAVGLGDAGNNYQRVRKLIQNNPDILILKEQKRIKEEPIVKTTNRPEKEIFKSELRKHTFVELGKKYGVSEATIRQKWTSYYGLPTSRKEINQLSDEEWAKL